MSPITAQTSLLFVGGTDSSHKAGLDADLEAAEARGCEAITIASAITDQDLFEVRSVEERLMWDHAAVDAIEKAASGPHPIAAMKFGLLPGVSSIVEAARLIARTLHGAKPIPAVVDPVIRSSSGYRFWNERELVAVRDLAEHWRERTSGAFNPGIARLTSLWENAAGLDTLPSQESLRDVLDLLAQDRVADLDFNGIAKGWIADTALASSLDAEPDLINAAWLNIGGDLVHRGVGSLVVGIEDPARPYDNVAPMATVEIANEALATSGGARRWWDIDGKRYSKVLDPRTGLPVDRVASATVVAADAATADVLATVALVLDPAEMLSLIEAEQAHCFVVLANGSTITSSNRFTQS